jgi:hypothetical protein
MQINLKALTLGLGASALLAGATALAQQYAPQQQPPMRSSAQPPTNINSRTLTKFKRAYYSVRTIEHRYSAEERQVHTHHAALKIRQRTKTMMVNAVQSAGLTIPQYISMMLLMQREPALRRKVIGH